MHGLKKKRIGILTSGGDAPGMNNVINAVYKTFYGLNYENSKAEMGSNWHLELVLIKNGYRGLYEKSFQVINENWANLINLGTQMGGTIIGSSRFPEFETESIRAQCIANLKKENIEGLIVVGGDGTYKGIKRISTESDIKCIGIPGTIDNDVTSSEFTIGFDTALNTIVQNIDKIRQTANSHTRIMIVEVMGRDCGDLALHAAAGTNCELVATKEMNISESVLIELIEQLYVKKQHGSLIVIVTEGIYDLKKLAIAVEKITNCETRPVVLGQIQRGGAPSAFDRYLATMMGIFAAERFNNNNKSSICVGLTDNKLVATEIQDALNIPKVNKNTIANKILRLSGVVVKK